MKPLARRLSLVITPLVVLAGAAAGQNPTRLPEVVSKADAGRVLRGVVLDTNGMVVPEAEIIIGLLKRRVIGKADGTFIFTDMPKGTFEVRARKIGYGPQVKTIKISGDGGSMEPFELVPIARALPAVVTAAGRLGLSGVVADTSFAGLPGVDVHIAGSGLKALTDSNGAFYLPARAGSYFVGLHKDGYRDRVLSVVIPEDSGRKVTVSLVPGEMSVREQANLLELQHRVARVTEPFVNLYSRDRIKAMGIEFAYDVAVSGWVQGGNQGLPDFTCFALVNGGPRIARLNELSIDEIESIEVYAGGGFEAQKAKAGQSRGSGTSKAVADARSGGPAVGARAKETPSVRAMGVVASGPQGVADSRPAMDLGNAEDISKANQGKVCPSVYVWTR